LIKNHKQALTEQKKDWSKINSLEDIKNMRFKEIENDNLA